MKSLLVDAIRLLFFYGWMPFAVLLLADGCHSLASGCSYLRMDTIRLQTAVVWKQRYFTFCCIHVQQLTPATFCFRNRRGQGCQDRQKIRDWKRSNKHNALIAETERLRCSPPGIGECGALRKSKSGAIWKSCTRWILLNAFRKFFLRRAFSESHASSAHCMSRAGLLIAVLRRAARNIAAAQAISQCPCWQLLELLCYTFLCLDSLKTLAGMDALQLIHSWIALTCFYRIIMIKSNLSWQLKQRHSWSLIVWLWNDCFKRFKKFLILASPGP